MNSSKKKSDIATILDDLRHDDPRKKLNAIRDIRQAATALGPSKVRSDLLGYLAQFVDDEETIVLELLSQLENFTTLIGGPQNQKHLIPLLLSFCKTDEKKVALKSCQIIEKIVKNSKELSLETIQKLMKTDMNVAKQCSLQLISNLLPMLEANESSIVQLYVPLFSSQNPQHRIIASKYLSNILRNIKGKEQFSKIFEKVYSEGGELQKIFALQALAQFYEVNNNFSLTKFKHLSVMNSWRINIKISQLAHKLGDKLSKPHFKLIFQPMYLKFMNSNQPELRSSSCQTLLPICKSMTDEEQKSKLMPILKKLASDQVQYVRVELSKNIVPICKFVSSENMSECIIPIIMTFIKDVNSEVALGIAKNFEVLATKMTKQALDEKIIKPILQQLSTTNWRVKCEIIKILKGFLTHQTYLNDNVIKMFISLTEDRIDAVRLKATEFIIEILSKNSKDWCDQNVLPKVFASKENQGYIKKQNLLDIIEKTAHNVSDKALKDTYQSTIMSYITDKVPNVRVKSIQVLKTNSKLINPNIEKFVEKLKQDKDHEVRDLAKRLRA